MCSTASEIRSCVFEQESCGHETLEDKDSQERGAHSRRRRRRARFRRRRLRSLLEIMKTVRSGADVDSVVDAIARVVAETLGFQTVVSTSTGPSGMTSASRPSTAATRSAKRCSARSTTGQLDAPPGRRGSPARAPTSSRTTRSTGRRTTAIGSYPPASPRIDGPEAWHPNDELFVPLEHSGGRDRRHHVVRRPARGPSGRTTSSSRSPCALASHAALALEAAQERARSQRHQAGLEQLLHVTSQLPQTISTEGDAHAPSARRSRKRLASTRS